MHIYIYICSSSNLTVPQKCHPLKNMGFAGKEWKSWGAPPFKGYGKAWGAPPAKGYGGKDFGKGGKDFGKGGKGKRKGMRDFKTKVVYILFIILYIYIYIYIHV